MLVKLIEIGKRLLSESDINRVLTVAIDGAIEITGAERGMIILFGNDRDVLFETARTLKKEDIKNPKFEISRTIIDRVKSNAQSICLHNALEEPSLGRSASAARLKILSVICLPLRNKKQTFGVVYLDNRTVEGAFEPETFEFSKNFADFISLAAYKALERKQFLNRVNQLEAELRGKYRFEAIIGHHPSMVKILKLVAQIANSDATVLITGESGTGKELLANALHYNSNRKTAFFVPINCGALPENLLESELFGHVKGAFTGAINDTIGFFEKANGGTIFLDEVSEMSPALQVKLLRVLQTGEFSPVGSSDIRKSDVRVVAATNQDLKKMVDANNFREDVYYRLNVVDLEVPPLRERRSDIPLLLQHFLKIFNGKSDLPPKQLSQQAENLLRVYDFPGNVRELENAIQRAVTLCEGEVIEVQHLPRSIDRGEDNRSTSNKPITLTAIKRHAADQAEGIAIEEALRGSQGNISQAARMLDVDVSNFHKAMRRHGIDAHEFKTLAKKPHEG